MYNDMEKMLEEMPFDILGEVLYSTQIMEEEDFIELMPWFYGKNCSVAYDYQKLPT